MGMGDKIGFLSVRYHVQHGYFGGYLILNHLARPLEFHCTMPVQPIRAQELLYGKTLHDFVSGEQIAAALIKKAKLNVNLVVTDCPAVLSVQHVQKVSVVQLHVKTPASTADWIIPDTQSETHAIQHAGCTFNITDQKQASELLSKMTDELPDSFDFEEPFQRIEEALLEAHPLVKAA
jgi:hypothetical protein